MDECCGNCACFARISIESGTVLARDDETGMPVCRRQTPGGRFVRAEVPVIHDGKPVIDRGKPRLEAKQVLQVGYPPVLPDWVCWDGWRPQGTRPGEPRNANGFVTPL
jgi:hypothetical protein